MPNSHKKLGRGKSLAMLLLGISVGLTVELRAQEHVSRPNILLILLDDLGFSDLGSYGSEIETPNLDRLAENGVRFTQFYNTGRCCPTRASLLTGLHPHQTGIGHMTQTPQAASTHDRNVDGYRGFINDRNVTVAQVLRDSGYHTLMTGKWHLGYHNPDNWPLQRGFERYYGIISGASNYFSPDAPRNLTLGNDPVPPETTTDRDYYTTDAFTDYGIRFIEDALEDDDRPFFLYLAYTAPHWPLHAFEEEIEKYRGRYQGGWKPVRQARYERMIELGLIDPAITPLTRPDAVAWEELSASKQDEMDLRMATYAAMIDRLDQRIGDLMDMLEARGQLDNTLILLLSDNGAAAEGGMLGSGPVQDRADNLDTLFVTYGQVWANVSNTPFRLWKHFLHEGGMSSPLIIHWPNGIDASITGEFNRDPAYLPDIMPTLLEVAGAKYPGRNAAGPIPPMEGVSLVPTFSGKSLHREAPMYWEHEGNRAIRDGRWKLVSLGNQNNYGGEESWELYDMSRDRSETRDLRGTHPEVAERLRELWWEWAKSHQVVPTGLPGANGRTLFELAKGAELSALDAPFLPDMAFTIDVAFTADAVDGVIVAQGGSANGFALYVQDRRLVFATRHDGRFSEIRSDRMLPVGPVQAKAVLSEDGEATLWFENQQVASAQFPGLLLQMPIDGLEVGKDLTGAVGRYVSPNVYPEAIDYVRIELE